MLVAVSMSQVSSLVREHAVHAILARSRGLVGAEAQDAASGVAAVLRAAPIRIVPALDRAFRDAHLHARLGLPFLDLTVPQVGRLARLESARSEALGVASLVRDGRAREAAVRCLGAQVDLLATAFLINRLNDYVQAIARAAWAALEPRLTPLHAASIVACLPLIERMSVWIRAGSPEYQRLHDLIRSPDPRCVAALWGGARSGDGEVRRAACVLLAKVHAGTAAIQGVIEAALASRDLQTRRLGAQVAADPRRTPIEALRALAPALIRDPAPAIRRTGVHACAAAGDRAALERLAFDRQGEVRHLARVALAERFTPLDYRGQALATLVRPDAERDDLLAALATLSDFGRRADIPRVAAFVSDPRPSLAREARRTLALLEKI